VPVRRVAIRTGATHISSANFGLRGPRWYAPHDPIHFNDHGADRMGQQTTASLAGARVLDAARRTARAEQID